MPQNHLQFGLSEQQAADRLIALGLAEDLGAPGDLTTRALVEPGRRGVVQIVSRQPGVLAGLPIVARVFQGLGAAVEVHPLADDGNPLEPGSIVARLAGPLAALLEAERTVLNFLTHLSGIATLTSRFVAGAGPGRARVFDTRKTLPGWRTLEKYAVRAGGGCNHRTGLYDMILIKDNHLAGWCTGAAQRTLAAAVQQARARAPKGTVIEIEVDTLDQLADALDGHPEIVLLDNMAPPDLRRAVEIRDARAPHVALEASGGVTLGTIAAIAAAGVERISVGQLTHSASALDLGLDWAPG